MKVVRLSTPEMRTREQMVSVLEGLIKDVEEGRLKNFIVAGTNANGEHEVAMVNVNFIEAQTLIGALQVDITMWAVRENFD